MKPNDLNYPFSWEERKPCLSEDILWVPEYYSNYPELYFPGWFSIFQNDNPVHVEYCSGNGTWLIERAQENPNINWVAIEKRFDRVRKIWAKAKNRKLNNVFIVSGEGLCATTHYFPGDSVQEVYVNFPDPWPKDRHAKHRIIQGPFVEQMARILRADGAVNLVTDDAVYAEQMAEEMLKHPRFKPCYPEPYYITELPDYGTSFFEELWRSKGRTIRYQRYNALPIREPALCV